MMLGSSAHDQCGRLSSPRHHLGEVFPADQRRALLVQQQQILRAAEQAVLDVQIGQRNHSPSAMSGSTQTPGSGDVSLHRTNETASHANPMTRSGRASR